MTETEVARMVGGKAWWQPTQKKLMVLFVMFLTSMQLVTVPNLTFQYVDYLSPLFASTKYQETVEETTSNDTLVLSSAIDTNATSITTRSVSGKLSLEPTGNINVSSLTSISSFASITITDEKANYTERDQRSQRPTQQGVIVTPVIPPENTRQSVLSSPNRNISLAPLLFHLIHTTTEENFGRMQLHTVETIFYHHPNARVIFHVTKITAKPFQYLLDAGYDIQIRHFDIFNELNRLKEHKIVSNDTIDDFAKKVPGYANDKKGKWMGNESDLLRLILMYFDGGMYLGKKKGTGWMVEWMDDNNVVLFAASVGWSWCYSRFIQNICVLTIDFFFV
jgi:hypothetical protein